MPHRASGKHRLPDVAVNSQSPLRLSSLAWPAAGLLAGAAVSVNPVVRPDIPLPVSLVAWAAALVLALVLPSSCFKARAAAFVTGLLLSIPCFVREPPLTRGLLMCLMCMPYVAAGSLALAPPISEARKRVAYLCAWGGTHPVRTRPRSFHTKSLLHLVTSAAALIGCMAAVKHLGPDPADSLVPARWLFGGLMILSFAEMASAAFAWVTTGFGVHVKSPMQSPMMARSVSRFWTRHWNTFASEKIFQGLVFAPWARPHPALALCAAFLVSGVAHALLVNMATGKWDIALLCGGFFAVQPALIGIERYLRIRRRPVPIQHLWTLGALTLVSPLFVEPVLQMLEGHWGGQDQLLPHAAVALAFLVLFSLLVSIAARLSLAPKHS